MASETMTVIAKTCSTCGKSYLSIHTSCPYCSGNSGKSAAEPEQISGCWSPTPSSETYCGMHNHHFTVGDTCSYCRGDRNVHICTKHNTEYGPLRECAGCVAEKVAGDNLGKTIGELDWQAERSHPSVKGTVTRNDILAWHRQICEEARDLAVRKNRDYAADADPLRNFRLSSQTAGISMSQCALVYLGENVAKYRSFIENGGRSAVKTEKLIDHIRDSINFNILLYAILIDEGYFVHEQKES